MIVFLLLCNFLFIYPELCFCSDYGGTLTIAYKDPPTTLNPIKETSSIGSTIAELIFDGLVELTPSGNILPGIAAGWTTSEDNLQWTFNLRDDVRFHDGSYLTAEDVVFSYGDLLKSQKGFDMAGLFQQIDSVEAVDEHTVVFSLKHPGHNFLYLICYVGVFPRDVLLGDSFDSSAFDRKPVGTGPYKIQSWSDGGEIVLAANNEYFLGKPFISNIRLIHISDETEMWKALETGNVDVVYNEILPEKIESLGRNSNLNMYQFSDYMNYELIFNHNKKLFSNRNFRSALDYAIDRKAIVSEILAGKGSECVGIFPCKGIDPALLADTYDPQESIAIFERLGIVDTDNDGIRNFKGKNLQLEVIYDENNAIKERALLLIQNQLWEVGIGMKAVEMPIPQIFMKSYTGDFDLIFFNHSNYFDMPYLQWHSDFIKNGHNLSHYNNPEVDALLKKLLATSDVEQRRTIKDEITGTMHDDHAAIFLFARDNIVFFNKRIFGVDAGEDLFPWDLVRVLHIPGNLQN